MISGFGKTRWAVADKEADADKHELIMGAARELFTTRGYESTTMAEVARKAGVAVGTVYLYFRNKSDLLVGVRDEWEARFLSYIAHPDIQATPHHLRARPLIEAGFALCAEQTEMVQLMGLQPELMGHLHTTGGGIIKEALEAMFEEGMAAGAFRQVDSRAAAVISYGMVNQALIECFIVNGGEDQQRYIDALVDALESWLIRPELLPA